MPRPPCSQPWLSRHPLPFHPWFWVPWKGPRKFHQELPDALESLRPRVCVVPREHPSLAHLVRLRVLHSRRTGLCQEAGSGDDHFWGAWCAAGCPLKCPHSPAARSSSLLWGQEGRGVAWGWVEAWSSALAFLLGSCPSIILQAAQDPAGLGQRAGGGREAVPPQGYRGAAQSASSSPSVES